MKNAVKNFCGILAVLIFSSMTSDNPIDQISRYCKEIDASLLAFRKIEYADADLYKENKPESYSIEGSELYNMAVINLDRYYRNETLKKAIVSFDAEREEMISQYYYRNDAVIMVHKTRIIYEQARWEEDFNREKKKIEDYKVYLGGDTIVHISGNMESTKYLPSDVPMKDMIIQDAQTYRKYTEAKEDFSTFLTKFKSSEEFQMQRVIFPLKYTQFQDFDMDNLDTTIVKADYICQDLEFKEEYFYKIIDGDSMEEKLYEITGKECGIYVLYHFHLKNNEWYLVKLDDLSN
jgi:hypothetical protein